MDFPKRITESRLWGRLSTRLEYVQVLWEIRSTAEQIGRQVERLIPEFTDHSVRHMDALWGVADEVLTADEAAQLSVGESLLLTGSFYIHDLGMACAATDAGIKQMRLTTNYVSALDRLQSIDHLPKERADVLAIRLASRELHAKKASDLVTKIIPGIDRFLIENADFRNRWAHLLGQVAESHHWDLKQVHQVLGARNAIPTADGEVVDLGYVACLLRLVDYAHINRERAPNLERVLRSEMSPDSILHWDSQANVTGPVRQLNELVYSCTAPIEDVDAWWLFFDMASGLDNEIRRVREYLTGRAVSSNRLHLLGVKGVESPQSFIQHVQLAGDTVPIDIRVQPHSMERVVELLGGSHLYGPDQLAPVRELIQNARDAIILRAAVERRNGIEPYSGRITISMDEQDGHAVLIVRDNGIGMKRDVVVRYLIGVGSDYWHSADFYRDHGKAVEAGFEPIGKFGIGFLSAFMLGDLVEVETEAVGSPKVKLRLRGLGRRGDLSESQNTGQVGTEIRVWLKPRVLPLMNQLAAVVRARAPMLTIPIDIRVRSGSSFVSETIEAGWWKHLDDAELLTFVKTWRSFAFLGSDLKQDQEFANSSYLNFHHFSEGNKFSFKGWPGLRPQSLSDNARAISSGGEESFGVVRCSQGIAIDVASYPDITGVMEVGPVDMTPSRDSLPNERYYSLRRRGSVDTLQDFRERLGAALALEVIAKLNDLERFGMIPARFDFLRYLAKTYGVGVLQCTSLRWIPVLEPPGNIIHRSRAELVETLSLRQRVIVGTGMGPVSAYSVAAGRVPTTELGDTLIIAIRNEEVGVGYSDKPRLQVEHGTTIVGHFEDILTEVAGKNIKLEILPFLLELIAEAWNTSINSLHRQTWVLDIEHDIFWCALERGK